MNIFLTILYTVLIFGVIIFIHEFGHFITARLCGVRVIEFAMGMGPAIFKHQGKKTLYSLRLFPIGGYCAMEGEDDAGSGSIRVKNDLPDGEYDAPEIEESEIVARDPKLGCAVQDASVLQRLLIFSAGALMNLLLGFLILLSTLINVPYYSSTIVADFKQDATTSQSGLQVGDQIVKMNGMNIFSDKDIVFSILRDDDGTIGMEIIREGERIELPEVKFTVNGSGSERSIYLDFRVKAIEANLWQAIVKTGQDTFALARNSWMSIVDLITGRIGFSELSGPVGVGQVVGQAAEQGLPNLLSLAAVVSISVGMFNLLPFPALDGGRIIFLLIEGIRRKPVNPKWEGYINAAGLILLLGLMLVITCKDIFNLF